MSKITRDPYQCNGKQAFASHSLATRIANRRRKGRHIFKNQKPYKCEVCGQWHIGTARRPLQ